MLSAGAEPAGVVGRVASRITSLFGREGAVRSRSAPETAGFASVPLSEYSYATAHTRVATPELPWTTPELGSVSPPAFAVSPGDLSRAQSQNQLSSATEVDAASALRSSPVSAPATEPARLPSPAQMLEVPATDAKKKAAQTPEPVWEPLPQNWADDQSSAKGATPPPPSPPCDALSAPSPPPSPPSCDGPEPPSPPPTPPNPAAMGAGASLSPLLLATPTVSLLPPAPVALSPLSLPAAVTPALSHDMYGPSPPMPACAPHAADPHAAADSVCEAAGPAGLNAHLYGPTKRRSACQGCGRHDALWGSKWGKFCAAEALVRDAWSRMLGRARHYHPSKFPVCPKLGPEAAVLIEAAMTQRLGGCLALSPDAPQLADAVADVIRASELEADASSENRRVEAGSPLIVAVITLLRLRPPTDDAPVPGAGVWFKRSLDDHQPENLQRTFRNRRRLPQAGAAREPPPAVGADGTSSYLRHEMGGQSSAFKTLTPPTCPYGTPSSLPSLSIGGSPVYPPTPGFAASEAPLSPLPQAQPLPPNSPGVAHPAAGLTPAGLALPAPALPLAFSHPHVMSPELPSRGQHMLPDAAPLLPMSSPAPLLWSP